MRNVKATFGIFSLGAIQIISCRARLVTLDETWLYHYDPETKQQYKYINIYGFLYLLRYIENCLILPLFIDCTSGRLDMKTTQN
jgi:hypothetical protein